MSHTPALEPGSAPVSVDHAHLDALNEVVRLIVEDDPARARELSDETITLACQTQHQAGLACALRLRGTASLHLAELEAAREDLETALALFSKLHEHVAILECQTTLSIVFRSLGDYQKLHQHATDALNLSRDLGLRAAEADALQNLAAAANAFGRLEHAVQHLQSALQIRSAIGDARGELNCLGNLGILYTALGEYTLALEHLMKCRDLIHCGPANPKAEASCLVNLGNVYQHLGQYEVALGHFSQATALARELADRPLELIAVSNMAELHLLRGAPEDALKLYKKTLKSAQALGLRESEIDALDGLGKTQLALKRPTVAQRMIGQALAIAQDTGNQDYLVRALMSLSDVQFALGHLESAHVEASRALEISEAMGSKRFSFDCHNRLVAISEAQGNLVATVRHLKLAHQLEREIFNEQSDRKAKSLALQFDLERTRNEAETLRIRSDAAQWAREEAEEIARTRTLELEEAQMEILERLLRSAEVRDDDTVAHTQRVGDLSAQLARALGLPEAQVALIRKAAPLHDIGKIGVPDAVLYKKGKFNADEYAAMKDHTLIGARILQGGRSMLVQVAEEITLSHHERWDGSGYPKGLRGEKIPLSGRIVAVADVFDALTSERPYKKAWSVQDALNEISAQVGRQFDPNVVRALLTVIGQRPGTDPLVPLIAVQTPSVAQYSVQEELDRRLEHAYELRHSDPQRCLTQSQELLLDAGDAKYRRGIGYAHRNLGVAYFATSEFEPALSNLMNGLEVGRELQDRVLARDCLNSLAGACASLGDHATAVEYAQEMLRINQDLGDKAGLATSLNNLSILYHYLGRNEDAVQASLEGIEISQRIGDDLLEAKNLTNLGNAYADLKRDEDAVEALRSALVIAAKGRDQALQSQVMVNLSKAYGRLGETDQALEINAKALQLVRAGGSREGEAYCLLYVGEIHLEIHAPQHAIEPLHTALNIAEEIRSRTLQHQIQHQLFKAYRALGQADQALEHYEAFHTLDRDVRAQEAERKVRIFTAMRDFEKAQIEAEVYRLRNVELAQVLEQKSNLLEELQHVSHDLQRQASEDALTGVKNRRYLESWLAEQFALAKHKGQTFNLAMIDIDLFKRINDRFSHAIGDEVLRIVGRYIAEAAQPGGLAARYGGEEFVLALPTIAPEQARERLEHLRRAVQGHHWGHLHPELTVTLSMGMANELAVANHEKLLAIADQRLYKAKNSGRNRICT